MDQHYFLQHLLPISKKKRDSTYFDLLLSFSDPSSSITASAVCLFMLDKQFYDVFTAPSTKLNRRTSLINNEINSLVMNCSRSIPSKIDRDIVESEKQFQSYSSSPLLIETMSLYTFTAINVIQYDTGRYCLIVGTSKIKSYLKFKALFFSFFGI